MSTSAIGSLTTLPQTQNVNTINRSSNMDQDDDGNSHVSGSDDGHRHGQHGDGALVENVIKALQSMGLNFPRANAAPATDAASTTNATVTGQGAAAAPSVSEIRHALHAFLHDLRDVLKHSETPQVATTPSATSPATTLNTNGTTNGQGATTTPSLSDISQALYIFLHDLRQALKPSESQQVASSAATPTVATTATSPTPPPTTDNDADDDNSRPLASKVQHGYHNFSANLQSLINTLGTGTADSSGPSSKLETDFSKLLTVLGGSADPAKNPPSLQDFLTKLLSNVDSNNALQTGSGAILNTKA